MSAKVETKCQNCGGWTDSPTFNHLLGLVLCAFCNRKLHQ